MSFFRKNFFRKTATTRPSIHDCFHNWENNETDIQNTASHKKIREKYVKKTPRETDYVIVHAAQRNGANKYR